MISPKLLELLVCPKCKGPLEHRVTDEKEWLDCRACSLRYHVIDDIPQLRVDKAEKITHTQETE